jgi:hypothetical protein
MQPKPVITTLFCISTSELLSYLKINKEMPRCFNPSNKNRQQLSLITLLLPVGGALARISAFAHQERF